MKIGKILESYPDFNVKYTRSTDVFIPLRDRAKIANDFEADLFVSVHCNSSVSPKPYGAMTLVMGLSRAGMNFEIAKAENAVISLEDNFKEKYEGFDPTSPESYMMFNLMQKAYVGNSISLADRIETQFREKVGRKSRGVKQGPFYVLWTPSMPSVLVELGFLSNTEEEQFLMTKEGQEYMASAIYRSIKDYKSEIEMN